MSPIWCAPPCRASGRTNVLSIRMAGAADIEKADRVELVVAAHGFELSGCFSMVSESAVRLRSGRTE